MNKKMDQFRYQKGLELSKACRINGLPLTPQRQAILETLAGRTDHPSADELFDEVKKQFQGISRATVYRVLETLVRIGVVQKIGTQEARARFDADTRRHPHILCLSCGKLSDLHDIDIADLMPAQADIVGFRLINYAVQFTGLCYECLGNTEAPTASNKSVNIPIPKEET